MQIQMRGTSRFRRLLHIAGFLAVILTITNAHRAVAQNASFTGRVTDPSGAVVPKAHVTVHNLLTGVDTATQTTNSGNYSVPYLAPGQYTLTVVARGFGREIKSKIDLQTSQVAVEDFKLRVGSVTETVTVDGSATLDRGKADRGEVVENLRVTELPLNGRTATMLARLDAGVIYDGNLSNMRPFDGQTYTNLHVNGSEAASGSYSNEVMMDGAPNQTSRPQNTGHHDVSYIAPDDAIQDFKIVTNPYDAQYGRNRGGVVDETLKTGTNNLHGDVYEFARRSWLDSNSWVNDFIIGTGKCGSGTTISCKTYAAPPHKLDQYGFELDGPVTVPKLYHGEKKLFFLMQGENWNEIVPATINPSVPETQWSDTSKGYVDFGGLTYNGQPATIYNPYDTYTDSKGNVLRRPFANNRIPTAMVSPVALKLLSYYPAPTNTGSATPYQQNYFAQTPTTDLYRNALLKLDYIISPKDRMWIRYGYWERTETVFSNGLTGWAANGEDPLGDRSHTFATEYTHTFTPNLLLDVKASVNVKDEQAFTEPQGFDLTSLGWSSAMVGQFGPYGQFPSIGVSGFATMGGGHNGNSVSNSLTLFPSLLWQKGKHTIRAGGDVRFFRYANTLNAGIGASLSFNQQWTQSCAQCAAGNNLGGGDNGTEGNSVASMLLGLTSGGGDNIGPQSYWTQPYYAPYIQDDWRVSQKLVLNLGVRYDVQPAPVERHNRGNYGWDFTDLNPVDATMSTSAFQLPNGWNFHDRGGPGFLGINGNPRGNYLTNKYDIQPRVGFAYSMTSKTVLRGGFGEMFQSNLDQFPNTAGFSSSTSVTSSLDGGNTPIPGPLASGFGGNLTNPFPTVVQPSGSSLGMETQLGQGPFYQNPNFQNPNYWSYSMGIEHQFSNHDTLEVSYVGTYAPNRYISQNVNHWNSAPGMANAEAACNIQLGGSHHVCDDTYAPGVNASGANTPAYLGYMANPYYQVGPFIGSNDYTSKTIQGLTFTQQMPQFGGITEWGYQGEKDTYNSLQVTAQHKWSGNLLLHGTWTYSKTMDHGGWADNNYLIPAHLVDGGDRRHNITFSGVYNLPIGRGQRFLGSANRIVNAAIGGWEFGNLGLLTSGTPFPIGGWDLVGNAKIKPYQVTAADVAADKYMGLGNIQGYKPCFYNTNAETGAITPNAAAVAYGCTSPNFIQIPAYGVQPAISDSGIRQPWGFFMDSNLSKNYILTDRLKLQTKLEAFNVLNHPVFQDGFYGAGPTWAGETGNATGGGQSNKPRQLQIALKLMW